MWARFTNSFTKTEKVKFRQSCRTLTVDDEYLHAVRTKSFADFFVKVQILSNDPSSHLLLDPGQEIITSVLESSSIFSNKSSHHLKSLLFNYFDITAEASSFCSQLLRSLRQIQAYHRLIHKAIHTVDPDPDQVNFAISDLLSTDLNRDDFNSIHENHSSVLHQLRSNRTRVARKIKMIKLVNRASGLCVAAACGLAAAATVFLAMHTLVGILMGPAVLTFPIKPAKKKLKNLRFLKYKFLGKVVNQLDVAAKGAYILKRDFDTMGRLVARLQDEIEHSKAMVRLCLERREDRVCLQVLKEIKKCEFAFRKQVEELEEHVYLCLVTINRARALVVKEICRSCEEHSVP